MTSDFKVGDRVDCYGRRGTVVSASRLLVGYCRVIDVSWDNDGSTQAQWIVNLKRISALEELAGAAE